MNESNEITQPLPTVLGMDVANGPDHTVYWYQFKSAFCQQMDALMAEILSRPTFGLLPWLEYNERATRRRQ